MVDPVKLEPLTSKPEWVRIIDAAVEMAESLKANHGGDKYFIANESAQNQFVIVIAKKNEYTTFRFSSENGGFTPDNSFHFDWDNQNYYNLLKEILSYQIGTKVTILNTGCYGRVEIIEGNLFENAPYYAYNYHHVEINKKNESEFTITTERVEPSKTMHARTLGYIDLSKDHFRTLFPELIKPFEPLLTKHTYNLLATKTKKLVKKYTAAVMSEEYYPGVAGFVALESTKYHVASGCDFAKTMSVSLHELLHIISLDNTSAKQMYIDEGVNEFLTHFIITKNPDKPELYNGNEGGGSYSSADVLYILNKLGVISYEDIMLARLNNDPALLLANIDRGLKKENFSQILLVDGFPKDPNEWFLKCMDELQKLGIKREDIRYIIEMGIKENMIGPKTLEAFDGKTVEEECKEMKYLF